jgi:hypothetical protein
MCTQRPRDGRTPPNPLTKQCCQMSYRTRTFRTATSNRGKSIIKYNEKIFFIPLHAMEALGGEEV